MSQTTKIFFLFIPIIIISKQIQISNVDSKELRIQIESARNQLQILTDEQETPCWRDNIISILEEECATLNYNARARIGYELTNCHLYQSGLKPYTCQSNHLNSCVKLMSKDSIAFSTYNQFFTHIDNLCIYVQLKEHNSVNNNLCIFCIKYIIYINR